MTDLEQKAREIVDEIYGNRADCCMGKLYDEYVGVVAQALQDVREADAKVAEEWPRSVVHHAKTVALGLQGTITGAMDYQARETAAAILKQGVK